MHCPRSAQASTATSPSTHKPEVDRRPLLLGRRPRDDVLEVHVDAIHRRVFQCRRLCHPCRVRAGCTSGLVHNRLTLAMLWSESRANVHKLRPYEGHCKSHGIGNSHRYVSVRFGRPHRAALSPSPPSARERAGSPVGPASTFRPVQQNIAPPERSSLHRRRMSRDTMMEQTEPAETGSGENPMQGQHPVDSLDGDRSLRQVVPHRSLRRGKASGAGGGGQDVFDSVATYCALQGSSESLFSAHLYKEASTASAVCLKSRIVCLTPTSTGFGVRRSCYALPRTF